MNIALMGTRGIPASYSGFETCVEQLGQRLVQRGHKVTVYCRTHHINYSGAFYKGMRLVKMSTIANKFSDTLAHSFITSLHALTQNYDVALYFIAGNSPVTWIPRLIGTKTLLNVDGLDWKREKWPEMAKKYIRFAEYLATKLPDVFVTDSQVVQGYYSDTFGCKPPYIAYGSEVSIKEPGKVLAQFGLEPQRYILFVGRLVPENCVHHLINAFQGLDTDYKCVIVGDAPYAEDYIASLKALAQNDPRVIFTGYRFGQSYYELGSNSYLFVETSGVGGTHPAVLEAMAFGNCVIVNDTLENLETIGQAGLVYDGAHDGASLRTILKQLLAEPQIVAEYRQKARKHVRRYYRWDDVTDAYERLFYRLCRKKLPLRLKNKES